MRTLLVLTLIALSASAAQACSIMIPRDPELPPLVLEYQKVDVRIDNLVAITKVDQSFKNNSGRQLEATYVFPLPDGASVTDFALYINGKKTRAEMMEKNKAREIYEEIVRKAKDPGLLEFLGDNLFQARVFPVPARGSQRVEIKIEQKLEMDGGLAEYRYPLKALKDSPPQEFDIDVAISSAVPLKSIYSPSHTVKVTRDDDNTATVDFKDGKHIGRADFSLFLSVSEKDFGLNLLCSRQPDEAGYFLMMLAPRVQTDASSIVNRDLVFVIDTSGSMRGEKMRQAREAVKFCVSALNPGDRFNVIGFATNVETFARKVVPANQSNVKKALRWVDRLEALGGTAIGDALESAFGLLAKSNRPATVVFLTDGKPTVGLRKTDALVKLVGAANSGETRLFALGVGEDLDAKLLDALADENRGVPVYIAPGEDIEVKVSSFYRKIRHPVLTHLSLNFGSEETFQLYPTPLPDLYSGSQLAVYGRYRKGGKTKVNLTGQVNGKEVTFRYDAEFADQELEREFIPRLWATRRVGNLLALMRKEGEQKELKDEVIDLAKRFGIVTPYTSYLVVEDEELAQVPVQDDIRKSRAGRRPSVMAPPAQGSGHRSESRADEGAFRSTRVSGAPESEADRLSDLASSHTDKLVRLGSSERGKLKESISQFMDASAGAQAVAASREVQELKNADVAANSSVPVSFKSVDGRTFELKGGIWTDQDYKPEMESLSIKYGSKAYFDLVFSRKELKRSFALGKRVIIVVTGKALIVGNEGQEELTAEAMEEFFRVP